MLSTLGYRLEHRTPEEAAFGSEGRWTFRIYPVAPDESIVGARCHVAVSADTQNQIRKFHELAIERGAISVRIPGERPEIRPDYFGTVIRDLDGHTMEVAHRAMQRC